VALAGLCSLTDLEAISGRHIRLLDPPYVFCSVLGISKQLYGLQSIVRTSEEPEDACRDETVSASTKSGAFAEKDVYFDALLARRKVPGGYRQVVDNRRRLTHAIRGGSLTEI
jgi:hypothetical protein